MSQRKKKEEQVGACFPLGFEAAGVAAGIKKSGAPDVCVLRSRTAARAAGVFTTNIVQAAPVRISRDHLLTPEAHAVIISSGNANAATGAPGLKTAEEMCAAVASVFGCKKEQVLIAQTGLIGIPLDTEKAVNGSIEAAHQVSSASGLEAATAMMTTDTKPKLATRSIKIQGQEVRVGGMAKGAAMLSPSMATMLAVLTTDAAVGRDALRAMLNGALADSFHAIVVDGCRSTNDTVFLLANGMSEAPEIVSEDDPGYRVLAEAVAEVCRDLALQMIGDAEGGTKILKFTVTGAASEEEARAAAKAVVQSVLVKCSLAGKDAYWGRILSELGASGATFDPDLVQISYAGEVVCKNGTAAEGYDRKKVEKHMLGREIEIEADLKSGASTATAYGCDLTHAYLDENMGTS